MNSTPRISLAIPIHDTPNTAFFLSRLLKSIASQTFKDYEIVITKEGAMAKNHNAAIKKSRGEIVKFIQMDDYLAHTKALQDISDSFSDKTQWMISSCIHTIDGTNLFGVHHPKWSYDMHLGNNTLGGFSTLALRNDKHLLLNEELTWVVDCELYRRYYDKYGLPEMLDSINVVVDVGEHRLSSTLPNELKAREVQYMMERYPQ